MGYFDESDEDDEPQPQQEHRSTDDDPLDAYMKTLSSTTDTKTSQQRFDLENEEEATEHWQEQQQTEVVKTDNDDLNNNNHSTSMSALEEYFVQAGSRKQLSKDHWKSIVSAPLSDEPFEKSFWTPVQTALGRAWRHEHGVQCSWPIDPVLQFSELRTTLGNDLTETIQRRYQQPTLVQSQTLAVALAGKDAIVTAQTGQGKTLAYVWPLIVHVVRQRPLLEDTGETGPMALILVPTRELAQQVHKQVKLYLPKTMTSKAVVGGQGKYLLWQELKKKGVEVVVATPGRLLDVLGDKKGLSLSRTTFCVLDEADKMLQMGFEGQVRQILSNIRKDRQTLLLSATMGRKIENVAMEWLTDDSVRISVGRTGEASEHVEQHVMVLPDENAKKEFLIQLLPTFESVGRTLVFVSTREGCEQLARVIRERLPDVGLETLHGDKHQSDRTAALKAFTKGRVHVLIATDVASRGLDVPQVGTVINFNVAKNLDVYVHRVGRAGRLSKEDEQQKGSAYTLLTHKDSDFARVLRNAFEREGREVTPELAELAESSHRAGSLPGARGTKNRVGLGFHSHGSTNPTVAVPSMDAPPAKRSRWDR